MKPSNNSDHPRVQPDNTRIVCDAFHDRSHDLEVGGGLPASPNTNAKPRTYETHPEKHNGSNPAAHVLYVMHFTNASLTWEGRDCMLPEYKNEWRTFAILPERHPPWVKPGNRRTVRDVFHDRPPRTLGGGGTASPPLVRKANEELMKPSNESSHHGSNPATYL